jgi:hypothetical protein
MSEPFTHIIDEAATRKRNDTVGQPQMGQPLYWCGAIGVGEFCFLDASHAVLRLKYFGDSTPCPGCLGAIRDVIDAELKDLPQCEGCGGELSCHRCDKEKR